MEKEAKEKIKTLVEKYEQVRQTGKLRSYTEEETKKDFILPLFKVLGWDVDNKNEVSAEESIISSGRVDYGFYLNDRVKFYVETKKLSVDLHKEEFANQAIRYSWNRGATWAILTDFESLKVFNAQDIEKSLADKKFFEIPYTEYLKRFDQLWLLSKEAFKDDLLDKEAEKYGKKLQKVSVTSLLYKDLQKCRDILTKYLGQWNPKVDKDLLDEGVQKLLDRLIFIRVAEDRGIEPLTLKPLVREARANAAKKHLYQSMIEKFREFDDIYNSNLFLPHSFEQWQEYSGATERVIDILYGKKGYYEYDFKAMPADVLGSVYENYLGYRLSQSKKKVTVAKDAKKRKEHGIYYTPSFIVDYIVKSALGPVLDKCKTVHDLKKIKVLDPACGSGSFLVKALEMINDKYKKFGAKGNTFTKLQILTENIYGVDLDEQAVEIARLNLLINALDERLKLPLLTDNIKNGNSLISGTDEELKKYFGKKFKEKKPFNWKEKFPKVFQQGGFDVVIGNPPYIRVDSLDKTDKDYWKKVFKSTKGKYDLYYLFIERGVDLLKNNGSLGFIVPNKFCVAESGKELRNFIFNSSLIAKFFSVSKIDIFKEAANYPILLFIKKGKPGDKIELGFAKNEEEILSNKFVSYLVDKNHLNLLPAKIIPINIDKNILKIVINLISGHSKLNKCLKISEGLRIPEEYELKKKEKFSIVKQYQFTRYSIIRKGSFISNYNLNKVINNKSERFINSQKAKIIIAEDALSITATLDTNKNIPQGGVYFATLIENKLSIKFLLGVLNSKLSSFVYQVLFGGMHMGGGYLRYRTAFLEQLPIKSGDKEKELKLINLVDKTLKLNKELEKTQENSNKWNSIKSEIEKIDKKIDEEVYKLYSLTPEEIKTVKNFNKEQ